MSQLPVEFAHRPLLVKGVRMVKEWFLPIKKYFFSSILEDSNVYAVFSMYRQNPLGFLASFFTWTVFLFFGIGAIVALLFPNAGMYGLALVMAALLSFALIIRVRVVVCENGLEFYGMRHTPFGSLNKPVFSLWKDISHVMIKQEETLEGGVYYDQLLCFRGEYKQPPINVGYVLKLDVCYYTTAYGLKYCVIDPNRLVDSAFGKYLMTYAPHVIESTKHQQLAIEAMVAKDSRK